MKNLINNLFIKPIRVIPFILVIPMVIMVSGCDSWLDVVPDNLPTIDDAFTNRATAEKSLFSCFRYLPDPTDPFIYPAHFIYRDELEVRLQTFLRGTPVLTMYVSGQNATDPILDYWSGRRGGTPMFEAIRTCNLFLDGIHQPRDMEEKERSRWIAEVKFLKAYYHFFLLQLYGPIPIVSKSLSISAPPDEVRVFREPVDDCINYIVQLFDEAIPDLPLIITDNVNEDGRITQPIALAMKAKALVWGASPLFNGNTTYQGWRDSRDKQLISDTYSREKWVRAATAIRNAIDTCHLAGHELYIYNRATNASTYRMSDSLALTMNTRKSITDRWNKGVLWSSMESYGGKPSAPGWGRYTNMQHQMFPVLYAEDIRIDGGSLFASFNMAETFYTDNGIPIDEDVDWNYAGRYQPKTSTVEEETGLYVAIGQQSASLNFHREPRFYANLGFDRGYLEISTTTTNGGASFAPYFRLRSGEPGNGNLTGYYVKKLIAFETSGSQGTNTRDYSGYNYRYPLFRLADLYLLYSEALNEVKEAPDAEVYEWIDRVREVAGLKGVVESWQKSRYPNRPSDKNEMRNIIRQERMIELAFEGQRFWDVRRWKIAENSWYYRPMGWDATGQTADTYYIPVYMPEDRKYTFKDYLWPIHIADLRVNPNLEQTYGW